MGCWIWKLIKGKGRMCSPPWSSASRVFAAPGSWESLAKVVILLLDYYIFYYTINVVMLALGSIWVSSTPAFISWRKWVEERETWKKKRKKPVYRNISE